MTCLRHDWQSQLFPNIFDGSPIAQVLTRMNAKSREESKISWQKWVGCVAVAESFIPCET
jgi:hypothetical protein